MVATVWKVSLSFIVVALFNTNFVLQIEPEPLLFAERKPTALTGVWPTTYAQSLLVPSIMTQILPWFHIFSLYVPLLTFLQCTHTHEARGNISAGMFLGSRDRFPYVRLVSRNSEEKKNQYGNRLPFFPASRAKQQNNVKKLNFLWKCAKKSKKAAVDDKQSSLSNSSQRWYWRKRREKGVPTCRTSQKTHVWANVCLLLQLELWYCAAVFGEEQDKSSF